MRHYDDYRYDPYWVEQDGIPSCWCLEPPGVEFGEEPWMEAYEHCEHCLGYGIPPIPWPDVGIKLV